MAFESERAELKKCQLLASSPLLSRRPASARSSPGDGTQKPRTEGLQLKLEPPVTPATRRAWSERRSQSARDHLLASSPALSVGGGGAGRLRLTSPGSGRRAVTTTPRVVVTAGTPRSARLLTSPGRCETIDEILHL